MPIDAFFRHFDTATLAVHMAGGRAPDCCLFGRDEGCIDSRVALWRRKRK